MNSIMLYGRSDLNETIIKKMEKKNNLDLEQEEHVMIIHSVLKK